MTPAEVSSAQSNPARWPVLVAATALVALAAGLLSAFHVGFQGSDDINYVTGALGWLGPFPYVGNSHWTLRHTITLPTAALVKVFGLREWSVSLSGIAYFVAFLAVNAYFARYFFGTACALIATALVLMAPGFPVVATYLNPDIPELFFVSASFWALLLALQRPQAQRRWLLLGVLAGLGYINRPTAAAFVLFAAVLFVAAPRAPRKAYLLAGLSFLAIVAMDWLFLTANTGDPIYRMRVDFNHDPVDRFAEAARVAASGAWIDKEGNLSIHVLVDPLLNVFLTQKYALLFWLAVPAARLAWRERKNNPAAEKLVLAIGLGLVSFCFVAMNPKLYLVPRYFVPAAWVASLAGAWWLARLWDDGRRWAAGALLAASVLVGAMSYGVENTDPRATERLLVAWVQAHPGESIHTDIETAKRSAYYFRFEGVDDSSVSTDIPPPASRFFYSEVRQRQCASTPRCRSRSDDFRPRPEWQLDERLAGPRRPIAAFLEALGLDRLLPRDVAQRLLSPTAEVIIYRVP